MKTYWINRNRRRVNGESFILREEKNKQKYKKKKIISLLLAVLLFGGIGYGAYVYMKTSSLVQKSNLNLARGENPIYVRNL